MARRARTAKGAVLLFTLAGFATAQSPTGAISGTVSDPSGATVSAARVKAVSNANGLARTIATSAQGDFTFPVLLAGEYEVSVEAPGFQRTIRETVVEAGTTTTADLTLRVGDMNDSVTVDGAYPQMHYDSHAVGGVVTHSQIEDLPLNGRSFLELAKLEPGTQAPARSADGRTFVPVLGTPGGSNGRGTRITIDGSSIMAPGYGGSKMGFSQEVVQEFQISTVNFDLSTGITLSGAVNVVTRSGGNDFHGVAFYFFRDHTLAAYPALNRDPANPDPFFQRRQFGFALGGPVRHDRIFFFGNWERNEQRGVASTTLVGDLAHFSGITPSPLFGDQASLRLDARISNSHTAFLRYSHDGNRSFAAGNTQTNAYPSNWFRNLNWADQGLLGLTSVLRPTLVNDLRFSYFFISSSTVPGQEKDCAGCLGIGAPTINVPQAGLTVGQSQTILGLGRRFQLTDSVTLQRGSHRVRFGIDWEHNRGENLVWSNEPVTMTLFSPDQVRAYNARPQTPANLRIPVPAAFNTLNDVLSLPLQNFTLGIGDPRLPEENGGTTRTSYTARLFFQDTWRLTQRLTWNYGLAWNVDRNQNYDLSKPALLAPILGSDGLGPTRKQWKNFSPSLGLAWSPSRDGKTVIRTGAGIFYDFLIQPSLDPERALLGPPGLGRQNIIGSSVPNPLSDIPGVSLGTPLDFRGSPTLFTGADLMAILPSIRTGQQQKLAYTGDPSVRAIQITKQASSQTYPANSPVASSQQADIGLQRQVARDFVVSVDFAYRHFIHLGWPLDLNHFNSVHGPVIPKCAGAQQNDPQALCSTGPINVWQVAGRATYKGLLVRADKRFSHGFQFLGSYAYSSNTGNNNGNGFNLDSWLQNPGPLPTDFTHILNLAGVAQLPRRFELGLNFSYSSAPPLNAFVGGIDFNGDGTTDDLLPGTTLGQFNRGLGRADLVRLVDQFNQAYEGTTDPHGRAIPHLALPDRYALDDNFHSVDLRLSRSFVFHDRWRVSLIGEVFNLYNKANLTGYSGDLTSGAFGQPTSRVSQAFGSGGPRAFQLAMRVKF
jgi:Carboxypeptidase regulatory-like domain